MTQPITLVTKGIAAFLRRHGVTMLRGDIECECCSNDCEHLAPQWAARLFTASGARPWGATENAESVAIFKYAADRSLIDMEFRDAVEAAIDAGVLVPFIKQRRAA